LPLLWSPPQLHLALGLHDNLGAVAIRLPVNNPLVDVIVVAVDDILVGHIGDGGACLEDAMGVGS